MIHYLPWMWNLWRPLLHHLATNSDKRDYTIVISDDILVEIFSVLPPSSVAISKAVCRRWHHLISRPYFTKLLRDSGNQDVYDTVCSLGDTSASHLEEIGHVEDEFGSSVRSFLFSVVGGIFINCILYFIDSHSGLSYRETFWVGPFMICACFRLANRAFAMHKKLKRISRKARKLEMNGKTLIRDFVCLVSYVRRQSLPMNTFAFQRLDMYIHYIVELHGSELKHAHIFAFWLLSASMSVSFLLAYSACSRHWSYLNHNLLSYLSGSMAPRGPNLHLSAT